MEPNFFHKDFNESKDIPTNLLDINVTDIDGSDSPISKYFENKKAVLIVNVASACGLTDKHYTQLVNLHEKFPDLQILAFPCNQFMGQESQCNLDIKNSAKKKFKVEFPMFSKIDVNGENTHPLFKYLKANTNELNLEGKLKNIGWNFGKFLLDGNGNIVGYFSPIVEPENIIGVIEKLF